MEAVLMPDKAPGKMPAKSPRVVVYLSAELKEELEALAEIRNRSVSNLLETVAREIVAKAKESGEIK